MDTGRDVQVNTALPLAWPNHEASNPSFSARPLGGVIIRCVGAYHERGIRGVAVTITFFHL